MGDSPEGQSAAGARLAEGEDADSPARSNFFTRLFRRDGPEDGPDEGPHAAVAAQGGPSTREIMVNMRKIRGMRVDDVSVPRTEIVAVPDDSTLEAVAAVFQSSAVSRLPVYSETLDQPIGLVHLKDLALRYGFGAEHPEFDLRGLVRPLLYAPPSMPIGVLLQKMQTARIHMALVIDEYGGVDGLVTIEDLLEQIVGEIGDEHDEDEGDLWFREAPGVYLAQARLELEDFEAVAGVILAEAELAEEVDTLGGLVFRLSGRVPARGEVVVHPDGHEFEVVDADARKIKRLRVRLRPGSAVDVAVEAAE